MKTLLLQFQWTLYAVCARRRTYIGFAAFLFFDLMVLGMMQAENLRDAARHFYLKSRQFSAAENFSGLTIAHFVLERSLDFLAPLFLALVAGDAVAKEVEDGTMSMALSRPVTRFRVLVLKWMACGLYTFAFTFFLAGVALACGLIDQGSGNLLAALPDTRVPVVHAFSAGLMRFAIAVPFLGWSLLTVTSIAFLFSCCDMKPLSATVATVSFVFADRFFHDMPIFKVFRPWFLTTRLESWIRVYEPQIPWMALMKNSALLLAINVALVTLAWLVFRKRDIKP
jgi:ABC-2 type transport system permease protein